MSIWFTALGVGCLGIVNGYMTFYSFRRQNPPLTPSPLPTEQLVLLLGANGAGGAVGSIFIAMEGVNYFGAYGIGLLIGVALNVMITKHEYEQAKKT